MDIEVENYDGEKKQIIITMDFLGDSFWGRIKYAWQILRGHWSWREFIVREEDHENLSKVFGNKYSELP